MTRDDLCPFCKLNDLTSCQNYPSYPTDYCPVDWKPEPEVNETANDNASHPIQALGRMLLAAGRK